MPEGPKTPGGEELKVEVPSIRRCMYSSYKFPECDGDIETVKVLRSKSEAERILAGPGAVVSHTICNGCLSAGRKGAAID